ncbi:MAG: OB-fold domain-containing protein [Acidobacteriota bacterium]|nr:OB-fold domain-containing protein [Acidobacteriota bacterium]
MLALARCSDCRQWDHPPQERCRRCGGRIAFEKVSGRGTVFSFIVNRRQFVPGHPAGEVIALVELEEQQGLRLAALVDADPAEVTIGRAVVAALAPVGHSEFKAPVFRLA